MHQTIRQALAHLLHLHRLDPTPIAHWQQKLRLNDELMDRLPGEVSGGELQRLAILRAMLLNPVCVFADEPTSRLDALTQRDTMEALCGAMADTSCAMLLVSHDAHLAQRSTHKQWHIQEGRLHADAIS
jgi:peptide/nickel transport system ATP-binding protein